MLTDEEMEELKKMRSLKLPRQVILSTG
jgi:hypothetical protein